MGEKHITTSPCLPGIIVHDATQEERPFPFLLPAMHKESSVLCALTYTLDSFVQTFFGSKGQPQLDRPHSLVRWPKKRKMKFTKAAQLMLAPITTHLTPHSNRVLDRAVMARWLRSSTLNNQVIVRFAKLYTSDASIALNCGRVCSKTL